MIRNADWTIMRRIIRESTAWEPILIVAAFSLGSCVGVSVAAIVSLVA